VVDRDDLFDHRERVLARLSDQGLAEFVAQRWRSRVLGWRIAAPAVRERED